MNAPLVKFCAPLPALSPTYDESSEFTVKVLSLPCRVFGSKVLARI